ncbi:hypothetical protein KPH14_007277 [Odynerus spinipes]|uniref:Multiple epidermal growth factor-like domains protein 10 n=1 Tax=Odynerus spinipes TaxID=1348599 RepID=A0AAD9VIK5_9HYME|nr:hypothetical protein KPH14_007277 [Odynerus spinipes]
MYAFGASLLLLWTMKVSYALSGDHICTRTENYTITSMESYIQPVVVNTFTWCLQVPPRCPRTHTEMRQRYRIKSEVKTRKVKECCEGYKPLEIRDKNDSNASCVPFCENCLRGVCVSPNKCRCNPGYQGVDCSKECSPGLWGVQCMQECKCAEDVTCDPRNGVCHCPPGFWGPRCEENCPPERWGQGCENLCDCKEPTNYCHPETGNCTTFAAVDTHVSPTDIARSFSTEIAEIREGTTDVSWSTGRIAKDGWSNYIASSSTDRSLEKKNGESTTRSNGFVVTTKTRNREDDITSTSTVHPVIVLVSVPERRKTILTKDRSTFALKDSFLGHFEGKGELRDGLPLKTDYVKTVHKEDVSPTASITLGVALIIIASIVFLSLMSIAIVTIIHARTKLFETVRLSIYNDEKEKSRERESEKQQPSGKISTIVDSALPQTPIRMNPVFCSSLEPAGTILPACINIEPMGSYANGSATIGLRISGHLRELLQEDHYDRPPTTLLRLHTDFESNGEHLYDEIPLQSTELSERKST